MIDNRTTELLPCPFCGREAEKVTSDDGFTSIGCLHCNPLFGVMIQRETEAEAIAAWNTRIDTEYGAIPATDENMARYSWVRERR